MIERFFRTNLRNSNALYHDSGGVASTPEVQFKEEVYAAAKKLLGDRIVISGEWSNDGERSTKWGVKLLRNRDLLAEHCRRYGPGGLYCGAIGGGGVIDWLVIYCTHLKPCWFTAVSNAKLVRAAFAKILDANNVVVAPKFPLPF